MTFRGNNSQNQEFWALKLRKRIHCTDVGPKVQPNQMLGTTKKDLRNCGTRQTIYRKLAKIISTNQAVRGTAK